MDGQQLITVSHNNDWQRWDLTTGQRLSKQDSVIVGRPISEVSNFVDFPVSRVNRPTDPKRPDQPQQLLITPDGQRIVMVLDRMEDNPFLFDLSATLSSARLLSRGDKLEHITIDSHSSFSKPRLVLSPNGQYLSRPSLNGNGSEILVWDRTKSREQFNLSGHRARVNDLSMTPDSRYLISGSHDSTLKMWNLDTREATRTFYGHLKPVTAVTVTPDGTHAISGSIDGSLKVWDLQPTLALDFVSDLPHHEGPICAVVATPDHKYVISGSVDQSIKVWYWPVHEATLRLCTTFEGHQRRVNGLAVSSDSQYLVSVSDERSIKVWDLITLTLSRTIVDQPLGVTAVPLYQHLTSGVATIPGSTQFVAEALEGGLKVGDCTTGQVSQVLQGTYEWTQGIASTPDGQYVITAHFRENRLIVWHLPSGKSYRLYEDGQHLETYYDSPVMRTFFTKHFFGEDTERPYYSAIAVTSDGKYVIAGSTEGQITIWDLLTLEKQCSIQAHQDTVTALATIPNLPYVVSCSSDCNLSIWDLQCHKIADFTTDSALLACSANSDGTIIAGSENGRLHCFQLTGNK